MPTPVSALIHAATMVTAGVYLLMRASPLMEYSSTALIVALWLGAITTVFSSLIGLFQQDIKKVIAYSTMSQLGMMVIAVGLSSYNIALFHLINHAFYKGLLFLGAGAVIHAVSDNQDFRKYGGLISLLPLTYSVMLIASLSLVAFPFMTGFYSKDLILESAYGQFYFTSTVVYFIASIGAMFTTLYSVKVLYLTFLSNPNGPLGNYKDSSTKHPAHEGNIFMTSPLIILAMFSIFFGYLSKDIFIGLGSGFFSDNSIFVHPLREIMLNTEFAVPTLFKILPLFFTLSLSLIAIGLSEFIPKIIIIFKLSRIGYNIFSFFSQRFFIELLYNRYITGLILKIGGKTTRVLDRGSVELLGPFGLEIGLLSLSRNISMLSTGLITNYALYILVGLIFYILIPFVYLIDYSLVVLLIITLLNINFTRPLHTRTSRYISYLTNGIGRTLFFLSLSISKNYIILTVLGIASISLAVKGILPLMPDSFNNDLIIYMNNSISGLSNDLAWLHTRLERLTRAIEFLLDRHERVLIHFIEILRNTDSGMLHDTYGNLTIARLRDYRVDGTFVFTRLSPEELINWRTESQDFRWNVHNIRVYTHRMWRSLLSIDARLREIDPTYVSRLPELAERINRVLWFNSVNLPSGEGDPLP